MFETVAATTVCDDFGLQGFRVKANGAAKKNVEAFERNAGDMAAENTGEGVVVGCARPRIVDARKVGVDVQGLCHRESLR